MSQSTGETNRITSQPLGTTSARLVAVKLKSANKNIFRALMSLGSANLVQRIMGLVNTTIVTARFGQGGEMDAYYIASILPLTLADLLSSAMEGSVIPVYARVRTKGSREKASRLYSTILNALLIGLVSLTAIMLIFRQPLVILFAPGVKGNELQLAVFLAIYAFPVLFFKIINSFLEALLNAEGQFGWPAYAGMLNPLVTAIFVLVGGGSAGVVMLCIGTIGGLLAELVIIIYRAYKADFKYKLVMDLSMPEVHTTAKTAIPSLAAGVISMASPLVDQIFASLLPTVGNIAALNNAQKLYSVPTGVILGAVGRAALPYLAAQAAIKDMKAFKNTFRLYLWAVTIATTVIAAGMAVLSYPMILVLLAHGKYTTSDASIAAITLSGLVIGLPPMAVGWIASKAFSALVMPRITIYISIFSIVANAVFDAIFGRLWGIFGIALATSALYCCTMVILLVSLRATIGKLDLLTPPKELLDLVRKFGTGQLFDQWSVWKEENLSFSLSYEARKQLMRILCILLTFAFGIGLVVYVDTSHQTVLLVPAIAFGLLIVLAWLRNPYFLLLCWAAINTFIGSNLPLFNGAHFLSGFTIPTLLLLCWLPTKKAFQRMPMLPYLLIYMLWMLIGITISPMTSSAFLTSWTTLVDYVGVGVLTVLIVNTRKRMFTLIDVSMVPLTFIALYGIWGYVTKTNGVVDPTTSYFRISSVFGNTPPTLAMYLSIMIPLVLYRVITLRGFKMLVAIGVVLVSLVAWGLTFDRTSQITIAISAIIMVPFMPTKRIRSAMVATYAGVGALIGLAAVALNIPIFARFANSDLGTFNGRSVLWQALIEHFEPTLLMGYGHGSSDILLQNIQVGFAGGVIATAAHNIFLESMFETGFIGLTIMTVMLIVLGVSLLLRARNASSERRILISLALGTFVSIAIQSFFSNDIWIQMVGIPFMIFMALPFALCWESEEKVVETAKAPDNVEEEPGEGVARVQRELAPV